MELKDFLRSPLSKLPEPERALIPRQFLRLTPGGGGVRRMQDQYGSDLHLLMWISSFVLLIACANVANLMLARGVTQRQEIAVQAALGAQRKRLVQRALVECVLVAALGGVAGVAVAYGGAKLILHLSG
ncbi:MAG TPA: FtsX-like permease family protein [Terracidiphilus sp.]